MAASYRPTGSPACDGVIRLTLSRFDRHTLYGRKYRTFLRKSFRIDLPVGQADASAAVSIALRNAGGAAAHRPLREEVCRKHHDDRAGPASARPDAGGAKWPTRLHQGRGYHSPKSYVARRRQIIRDLVGSRRPDARAQAQDVQAARSRTLKIGAGCAGRPGSARQPHSFRKKLRPASSTQGNRIETQSSGLRCSNSGMRAAQMARFRSATSSEDGRRTRPALTAKLARDSPKEGSDKLLTAISGVEASNAVENNASCPRRTQDLSARRRTGGEVSREGVQAICCR